MVARVLWEDLVRVQVSAPRLMNLISIIIPTFNRLKNIEACLFSIKSQSDANFETIVVDDNSTENLEPIRNLCDKFIRNEINGGPGHARNVGFLNSAGNILLFLDSDVVLRPGTLKALNDIFNNDSTIGAVGGSGPADESGLDVQFISGKSYNYFGQSKKTLYYPNSKQRTFDCHHLESAFLAIRREIYEKIGGFDPYWHYMGEDREICLNVKALGYRVVACLDTRAIHNSVGSFESNSRAKFWRFLNKRLLEVAIKRNGIFGGIRWLIGNWQKSFKPNHFFGLLSCFKDYKKLAKRVGLNFLSPAEQDKFYAFRTAQLLSKKLPFKVYYPLATPENITIFLTLKCNAKCSHCFIANLNSNFYEMGLDDISKIIDSLNQPTYLVLTGGEIFLRNDLDLILDKLMSSTKVRGIKLCTNGSLTQKVEDVCKKILEKYNKPLNVQVSLDGLKEVHDRIRKLPNGFDKAIQTCERIKLLKQNYRRLSLITAITIMQDNINNVAELVDFLEQKKIPSKLSIIRGNSFSTFGVPKGIIDSTYEPRQEILPEIGEIEKLLHSIGEKHPHYFNVGQKRELGIMLDTLKLKKRQFICYAGYKDAVIYSNGDVALCEQVKPFGALANWDWNFRAALNSREAWQQRWQLTNCACIHGCNISTSIAAQASKKRNIFKKIIKKIAGIV